MICLPPLCIGRRGQKYDKSVYYQSKAWAKVHDIATKLVHGRMQTCRCRDIKYIRKLRIYKRKLRMYIRNLRIYIRNLRFNFTCQGNDVCIRPCRGLSAVSRASHTGDSGTKPRPVTVAPLPPAFVPCPWAATGDVAIATPPI